MAWRRVDELVEATSRRTATRLTRRSFLGRAGQAAVLVASGPALATVLAEEAEARVCGQSGVAPKCPTYDCDHTWGWCWYASGCCTDGLLKKICDCCAPNTPHPVGYCPSGTRVFCIVESCGTDPRLQRKAITRFPTDDNFRLLADIRRFRWPAGSPVAVFGDESSLARASVAFPVASVVDGPLFLVGRGRITADVLDELRRMGVRHVYAVGGVPDDGVARDLLDPLGIGLTRVGTAEDPGELSLEVAAWLAQGPTGRPSHGFVAVGRADSGAITVPLGVAVALASRLRLPLVIGAPEAQRARAEVPWSATPAIHLVGAEAAATGIGGARAHTGPTPMELAEQANVVAAEAGASAICPIILSHTSPAVWAAGHLGQPVVLHEPGRFDWVGRYLFLAGASAQSVVLAGVEGALRDDGVAALQSMLNGFDAHKLIGVAGQGLPVISQPLVERPIGMARNGPAPTLVRVRRGRRWVTTWVWP